MSVCTYSFFYKKSKIGITDIITEYFFRKHIEIWDNVYLF